MSQERLRELLQQLHEELSDPDGLDEETLEMARQLDEDIHRALDPEQEDPENPLMDSAVSLEARFATEHPLAERVVRELIDALGRMGI